MFWCSFFPFLTLQFFCKLNSYIVCQRQICYKKAVLSQYSSAMLQPFWLDSLRMHRSVRGLHFCRWQWGFIFIQIFGELQKMHVLCNGVRDGRSRSSKVVCFRTNQIAHAASYWWIKKGKVGRAPPERRRGAHLPFKAIEPVGGWTTESVTHGLRSLLVNNLCHIMHHYIVGLLQVFRWKWTPNAIFLNPDGWKDNFRWHNHPLCSTCITLKTLAVYSMQNKQPWYSSHFFFEKAWFVPVSLRRTGHAVTTIIATNSSPAWHGGLVFVARGNSPAELLYAATWSSYWRGLNQTRRTDSLSCSHRPIRLHVHTVARKLTHSIRCSAL